MLRCINIDTLVSTKRVEFLGDSLDAFRAFTEIARREAGYQLSQGLGKIRSSRLEPMKTVGAGVREIKVREASGAFRVIYLASLLDRILLLHAFQKKTQQTARKDIDLAANRLRARKAEQ